MKHLEFANTYKLHQSKDIGYPARRKFLPRLEMFLEVLILESLFLMSRSLHCSAAAMRHGYPSSG
jgi:hypothetical protein